MGDKDGALDGIDLRAGKRGISAVQLHNRKLNTVHVDKGASGGDCVSFVTSSTDATVCLWDARMLKVTTPSRLIIVTCCDIMLTTSSVDQKDITLWSIRSRMQRRSMLRNGVARFTLLITVWFCVAAESAHRDRPASSRLPVSVLLS